MANSSAAVTPSDVLRRELERIGGSGEGVPDALTWEQLNSLARSVLLECTRRYSPGAAALIDADDFTAAAAGFMATRHRGGA